MLHRQSSVQPLISSGPAGGPPPVNAPNTQTSVPPSQPQPVVRLPSYEKLSIY